MPRILTNKNNLPLPLFLAIKNDTYEARGDISTTTLIDSPHVRVLRKYNEYTEDASENIWALNGQAIHSVVERVGTGFEETRFMPEKKLLIKTSGIEYQRVVEVSGTSDLIEITKDGRVILHDFKNIFVWVAKQGTTSSTYKKWIKQLNIYVYMIKECLNMQVNEIYVHAFIRDWNRNKSEYTPDYPEYPAMTFSIPIYSHSSILDYIKRRIDAHFIHEDNYKRGFKVSECEPEDRWSRPTVWKMIRLGKKRSLKNFTIRDDADEENAKVYYKTKSQEYGDLTIEKVPGEDVRCVNYCPVSSHCHYYQKVYGDKKEERGEESNGTNGDIQVSDKKDDIPEFDF
jgi:hypothetical protein